MRVNFSVTNQLATPSIHAAALANRPPAGQPGRLFVDTDNPSTGIYRDTGTVWENITGGAGAGNLQTVTDAGNTTDNNILLTYADNTIANALVFYNDALTQEEYLIEKRGTGITTNDSLAIQSRGNISPSTNPVGFLIDGANDIVKSFYTTSYSEVGLKLDFVNQSYDIGNPASTLFRVNDSNGRLQSKYNGDDIGISFDLQNGEYYIGDFDGISNGVFLLVDNTNQLVKTATINGDIGLKLDFALSLYYLGDPSYSQNNVFCVADNDTVTFRINCENSEMLSATTGIIAIGDTNNSANQTKLIVDNGNQKIYTQNAGNDNGLYLDFAGNNLTFGDLTGNDYANMSLICDGSGARIYNAYHQADYLLVNSNQNDSFFPTLEISSNTGTIKTLLIGNDVGLKLDFTNGAYIIGESTDLTSGYVKGFFTTAGVNPQSIIGDSDSGNPGNGVSLQVLDFTQLIKTTYQFNDIGLKLDFTNNLYIFGDDSSVSSGAFSYAEADSANFTFKIKTGAPAVTNIYANNDITKMGDVDVTVNGTTFGVDDTAEKLTASANLLVGSSGSTSGQHLKIKVGTTDYVIELKNP